MTKFASELRWKLPLLVLMVTSWLSTGSLNVFALTVPSAKIIREPECGYLFNPDHEHFYAAFSMLNGGPRESWTFAEMLRRILHPILSFPLMKLFGFENGGLIFNLLLTGAAFYGFCRWAARRFGVSTAQKVAWILATFPGIHYWIGSPYSYATIYPITLFLYVLLDRVAHPMDEAHDGLIPLAVGVGLCSTSYDFLQVMAPVTLILGVYRKKWAKLPLMVLALLLPITVVNVALRHIAKISVATTNTRIYTDTIRSYFGPYDWDGWMSLLLDLPRILILSFFDSSFWFLSVLILIVMGVICLKRVSYRPEAASVWLAVGVLILFLILNAGPPFTADWVLRGDWIARIYGPIAIALIVELARALTLLEHQPVGIWSGLGRHGVWLLFAVQLGVVTGPAYGSGLSSWIYSRFYRHGQPTTLSENRAQFGFHPFSFCKPWKQRVE